MYINGVVDLTTTLAGDISGYMNTIGSKWGPCDDTPSYGTLFSGQMANVMYYNTGLSAAQILQNYNTTKFRFGL